MNPYALILACLAQAAILYRLSPSPVGLATAVGITLILGAFAFTRVRWDAHLDMYLAMGAWGGLGMLLPTIYTGTTCHHAFNWAHYGVMSLAMWVFSLVPIWREARCLAIARREGRHWFVLLMDGLGMQLGMGLAHLPLLWLPMGHPLVPWLAQGAMLSGMGLGMMAAQWSTGEWQRQDVTAMG